MARPERGKAAIHKGEIVLGVIVEDNPDGAQSLLQSLVNG